MQRRLHGTENEKVIIAYYFLVFISLLLYGRIILQLLGLTWISSVKTKEKFCFFSLLNILYKLCSHASNGIIVPILFKDIYFGLINNCIFNDDIPKRSLSQYTPNAHTPGVNGIFITIRWNWIQQCMSGISPYLNPDVPFSGGEQPGNSNIVIY